MRSRSGSGVKLDLFASLVQKTLLVYQDPITGLYRSLDRCSHAWVRDNLYTVQLVFRKNQFITLLKYKIVEIMILSVKFKFLKPAEGSLGAGFSI